MVTAEIKDKTNNDIITETDFEIGLIYAKTKDNLIGIDNHLPWSFNKEDMEDFKKITDGNVVIMGLNTFNSLTKPLRNRINIIVSKSNYYKLRNPETIEEHQITLFDKPLLKDLTYEDNVYYTEELNENILGFSKYFGSSVYLIGGKRIYDDGFKYCNIIYETTITDNLLDPNTYKDPVLHYYNVDLKKLPKKENHIWKMINLYTLNTCIKATYKMVQFNND